MFATSGMMLAHTALGRIGQVMNAPTLQAPARPQTPRGNKVAFKDVSFAYDGADAPALSHVSFTVEPGQTVALVGPSGGGTTTAPSGSGGSCGSCHSGKFFKSGRYSFIKKRLAVKTAGTANVDKNSESPKSRTNF